MLDRVEIDGAHRRHGIRPWQAPWAFPRPLSVYLDPLDGFLRGTRYLIHDRDPLFTARFAEILRAASVSAVRLPPRSPNLNAFAERFVRSAKEECLRKVIPIGETHLRKIVAEYVEHYHRERNHQGLGNALVAPINPHRRAVGAIKCRERLGGTLRYCHREAA